jgi:hypothetical protein
MMEWFHELSINHSYVRPACQSPNPLLPLHLFPVSTVMAPLPMRRWPPSLAPPGLALHAPPALRPRAASAPAGAPSPSRASSRQHLRRARPGPSSAPATPLLRLRAEIRLDRAPPPRRAPPRPEVRLRPGQSSAPCSAPTRPMPPPRASPRLELRLRAVLHGGRAPPPPASSILASMGGSGRWILAIGVELRAGSGRAEQSIARSRGASRGSTRRKRRRWNGASSLSFFREPGMLASGAGCGCPPRIRASRMLRCGSMRLPACRRNIVRALRQPALARNMPRHGEVPTIYY